jgi:hypothetical protein
MSDYTEYKNRRLERLRLGQSTYEKVHMLDDPEVEFALIPATEAEYSNSLQEADRVEAGNNPAGAAFRDEIQRKVLLFHVSRSLSDLNVKFFDSYADVDELETHQVNYMYDTYLEMVAESSPSMMGLSEEDFMHLKKALPRIEWSDLSGPEWYAAQRFLNSIRGRLLTASYSGSTSTKK